MKKRAVVSLKKRAFVLIVVVGAAAIFQFDAVVKTTAAVSTAQRFQVTPQIAIPKKDGTLEKARLSEKAQHKGNDR